MKKLLTIFLFLAVVSIPALSSDLDYAYRIPAELQITEAQALGDLTWQQGSTPLIQVEVLRRGKPVAADTNTTVRMIIGPTATGTYYAITEDSVTTNTSYYVQWPTVGTNTVGTNTTAQAWWYTIYFERNGHRYWTGNGDLYIERTTSTDPDGLVWQTFTDQSVAWSNIVGNISNSVALMEEFLKKADANVLTAHTTNTTNPHAVTAEQVGAVPANDPGYLNLLSNTATAAQGSLADTAYGWGDHATNNYATGTPLYVYSETDPVWESVKAGYATGTPVYAETDPVFAASVAYNIDSAGTARWDTATVDASSATGSLAVIQTSTGAWTKAGSDASTATSAIPRIAILENSTSKWDTAVTDAGDATNNIAIHVANTTNPHAVTAAQAGAVPTNDARYLAAITNDTGATNIMPGAINAYDIPTRTLTWNTNAVVSTVFDYTITNQLVWLEFVAYTNGTNLLLSGTGIEPDVTGLYTNIADSEGYLRWQKDGFYVRFDGGATHYISPAASGPAGSPSWQTISGPLGDYAPNTPEAATGTVTATYSYTLGYTTNTWLAGLTPSGAWHISLNGVVLWDATNTVPYQDFIAVSNTVADIQTNYYPLQSGVAASNLAYTASTNAEAARVIATNAQAVADAALPRSGGTMTGGITMGTNATTYGTNNIALYGGVLDGTNGLYFVPAGSTNNYWILGGP